VHVLAPHAELCEQALRFLERAGVEPRFDLGVEGMVELTRLSEE
jgi:hypothetical protein